MRVCLMIEGQEGVTWPQWLGLAEACERAGLEALFRSDHYTGFHGGAAGSLDAWATVNALAAVTTRIRLGTLVSPASFRHPSVLAKMAVTAAEVSGGRVELGLGAGWHDPEHVQHGFPFPPLPERLSRFAEQLEIVHRSWTEEGFDFAGRHYELRGANPLPKPSPKPNLIVGGSARRGTVEPAVRFADEYNTTFADPETCRKRRRAVDEAAARAGREPLVFSLMTGCIVGADERELEERRRRLAERTGREPEERSGRTIVGTVEQACERLREYERAGVERVMLQHLLHDDLELVELLGRVAAQA
ncbi:MAG TPA: LLM class flavin-dependent oxidoreductase [Gaiellaceae bacterium]|jgi:alkanesulfonate monooxygenase SsuD/methylene tetrahydromethanopterin reductase-like flavin-dependent oxidoreductase (luciferase family)|nr:LLM class flavin-dependent oxidoreductase [Gaiellaceae bacterium]